MRRYWKLQYSPRKADIYVPLCKICKSQPNTSQTQVTSVTNRSSNNCIYAWSPKRLTKKWLQHLLIVLGTLQVLKHSWDRSPSLTENRKHNRERLKMHTMSMARACNHLDTSRNVGQGVVWCVYFKEDTHTIPKGDIGTT